MSRVHKTAGTLAIASLTLALAACGGGSDGDDAASDVIRVGTEGTYSPFTFHDTAAGNELTGYDVEVIEAVAAELGREVEFSETQWDAIFAGLEASRFDVIANQVTVNPERQEKYDFTEPYTVSTGVAVLPTGSDITSVADLAGLTSAQSATSNWAAVARESGAEVEAVEGFTQAVTLLKQGRVDVTLNDNLAVLDYLNTSGDTDVEIAFEVGEPSEQAFALRKDSPLTAEIDGALQTLRENGTLAEISERWFGEDVSG
ncbi:amino acid ABC transporter substrate-binding protein [Litorihabitans aurantiacus]|uniref:Amino acid ABC transporter substrate-binding protein n=1 Tax=Litorihabitans aurantiacus TaxID=1930061 RepID=A0AA37XEG5_9MICO|nr:amino acid ABC transporter substrate-binding protein [Litorihabitans aurantiacus]GMA31678.1 hypothetical protein GCM10025875_16700 [Litorihabitans aurantiacus]